MTQITVGSSSAITVPARDLKNEVEAMNATAEII